MNDCVGENVRRLRERAGLTQDQLAAKAGVSSVKMIEAGHRQGRVSTLQSIADALGVPLASLFEPRPDPPR